MTYKNDFMAWTAEELSALKDIVRQCGEELKKHEKFLSLCDGSFVCSLCFTVDGVALPIATGMIGAKQDVGMNLQGLVDKFRELVNDVHVEPERGED